MSFLGQDELYSNHRHSQHKSLEEENKRLKQELESLKLSTRMFMMKYIENCESIRIELLEDMAREELESGSEELADALVAKIYKIKENI